MNREQRIQTITVLWRNAEAASGRLEPLSAEIRARIAEENENEHRAVLAMLGVNDPEVEPPEEDSNHADQVRDLMEESAYLLRMDLVEELVQLDAAEVAVALISELPEEDRDAFLGELIEELTTGGQFNAAREAADAYFSNNAQRRLSLRVEIYRRDPKPEELPLLRSIADRTVEEKADFLPAAVRAFLDIWALSSDSADLECARALCRGIKTDRLRAYQYIASRTGSVSDFLTAFRYAGRFISRQTRAEAVNEMFGYVWISRKCDAAPDIGSLIFRGTRPLSRADTERLLNELKKLSPLWASVLRKKLEGSNLL